MKKNKNIKAVKLVGIVIIMFIGYKTFSQILYKNEGVSKSIGRVSKGSIENAYKIPYGGENFRFLALLVIICLDDLM